MAGPLPIHEIEGRLITALREHGRLILSAPTGSGKSTQVPPMLLRAGLLEEGQVVILQPRRLAARLLAARVAEELGVRLGAEVGYQIRFENVTSARTKIRFVTEGVLLRQMIDDPSLAGVACILFDEFHERHLYGDITLGRALELPSRRSGGQAPRLVVMSATLDTDALERFLSDGTGRCAKVVSEGRMHPVEIHYATRPSYQDRRPVWEQAAVAFSEYVHSGGEGDVLVFMPGSFEIAQTLAAIRPSDAARGFVLLPLHGDLPPREQDAAVARHDRRKVIVSTNVAETSLTIDGIRLVIDSGLARMSSYDPHRGINTLLIERISQSSANQRAGRAGRTAPGVCFRLWSEEEHPHRPAREVPEVRRLELSEAVLTLKAAAVRDVRSFRWLDAPEEKSLARAEELLTDLGATQGGDITPLGRRMLAFPVHPRYARLLLAAAELGCVHQAALMAALTQGRDLLLRNIDAPTRDRREDTLGDRDSSDFWMLMRAWEHAARSDFRLEVCRQLGIHAVTARQVGPLFQQFLRIAEREGFDVEPRPAPEASLRKCLLSAFPDHLARRLDQGTLRCELVHGRRGVLARESVVQRSELLVAAEVREVEGKEMTTLLSLATAVEPAWIEEMFPEEVRRALDVRFDAATRRVMAEETVRFRDLVITARRVEPPPADAAARLLAEEVTAGRLALRDWDHAVDQWIARLNLLAKCCPELGLPGIGAEERHHLIEQICLGALGYKDIKDRPVKPVVQSWLSTTQQTLLEEHAPERLRLANGRTPRVSYPADAEPFISLRIQELFGVTRTPAIALGRMPVTVHILAPSMRPVQITRDLAGFWTEHYPRIKSELQRKYPKHEWR